MEQRELCTETTHISTGSWQNQIKYNLHHACCVCVDKRTFYWQDSVLMLGAQLPVCAGADTTIT